MDTFNGYVYGGDMYGEEIIYLDDEELDMSSFDIVNITKIINYSNNNIKNIINECKTSLITKKKKNVFLEICNKLLKENAMVKETMDSLVSDKSSQFQELITNIYIELYNIMYSYKNNEEKINQSNIEYFKESFSSLYGRIKNLPKLSIISESLDKGIIIFGKNGSGKSKFMSFLMKVYHKNMVLMPAQKTLFFSKNEVKIRNDENDINELQHRNVLDSIYENDFDLRGFSRGFTLLISYVANQVINEQNIIIEEILRRKKKKSKSIEIRLKETLLDKINEIWNELIPDIIFKLDTNDHCIYPYNRISDTRYSINSLSDGEKAILYFICNVLLADKNSYIIIDEPETYLNPAIYIDTWNKLESVRKDCQFIYISHELDFIKSRNNPKLIWMKKYSHPDNWDFVPIEDNTDIPNDLIIEIYGSKNKVLFCEGDKTKKDYKIYNSLFSNKYTVVPVGGCHNVIEYTKSINKTIKEHGKSAIGIIDNDNRTSRKINALKKQKVFVTQFNEIEMLLCDEKILEKLTYYFEKEAANNKIEKFKNEFYKIVNKNKEKIAFSIIRESINDKLETYKINSKNVSDIESELQNLIKSLAINDEYAKYITMIDEIISKKEYYRLLEICNLKDEIVNGLGNKIIVNNYSEYAIGVITKDLKGYIKKTYFNDIDKI